MKQFLGMPDVQILAVCDVDSWRLDNAKQQVEEAYAKNGPAGSYHGCDAYKDFRDVLARRDIDAVKTRGETLEPAEVGHRVTSLGHLGQIAIQVGEKLKWDPEGEQFVGNDKANAMIDKPIHAPRT